MTSKKFTKVTLGMLNVKMDVQKITYTEDAQPIYAGKPGHFIFAPFGTFNIFTLNVFPATT